VSNTLYCFDTSALIDGWTRYYPQDLFPALWENLDALIANGRIASSDEVLRELKKKDDGLYAWAKERPLLFCDLDEPIQLATHEVLAEFPRLVDTVKNRSAADPFVVATARVRGATVVTGERNAGTNERPRIPNVCAHYGVRTLTLLQFIREQNWVFR
jgi:Domain of unknown function (DUF4411)